ncbi:hypothetical protein [Paenibacillus daejeonensis]|uniref:hypothetical protein n=1 Tax=Paenibacillus daejeonensis TaxID=135193 RepID=UPI003CCB9F05
MIDDRVLDRLGDYFVTHRVGACYRLTFGQFVEMEQAGTWQPHMGNKHYDFEAARQRIGELTALYRSAARLGDKDAQQELRTLVAEIEREIADAHASADSKIAVG